MIHLLIPWCVSLPLVSYDGPINPCAVPRCSPSYSSRWSVVLPLVSVLPLLPACAFRIILLPHSRQVRRLWLGYLHKQVISTYAVAGAFMGRARGREQSVRLMLVRVIPILPARLTRRLILRLFTRLFLSTTCANVASATLRTRTSPRRSASKMAGTRGSGLYCRTCRIGWVIEQVDRVVSMSGMR